LLVAKCNIETRSRRRPFNYLALVGMSASDSLSTAEIAHLLNRHGASAFTEDVCLLFDDYFTHCAPTDGMQFSDDDDNEAGTAR